MDEKINDPASCVLDDRTTGKEVWAAKVGEVPSRWTVEAVCTTGGCVCVAHLALRPPRFRKSQGRYGQRRLTYAQVQEVLLEFDATFPPEAGRKYRRKGVGTTTRRWFLEKARQYQCGHAAVRRVVYNLTRKGNRAPDL